MNTTGLSYQYANEMIGTLPDQRYEYYKEHNYEKMKNKVLKELNKMDEALGFFNVVSHPDLINALEVYNYAVMFIGLIFMVLLFIFVIVATLLIYSLLLISVETKLFEFGVMRLVGLTKKGFVGMVLI